MPTPRIIFDQGPLGTGSSFAHPRQMITATCAGDVPQALAALQEAQADGFWLAGFASYELGYAICPKLRALLPSDRDMQLLQFGVFDRPETPALRNTGMAELGALIPDWDLARYTHAFNTVQDHISAGDIYQANLTFPLCASLSGEPESLYAQLKGRQQAPFGAYVDLGGPVLLSRSPELFFRRDRSGQITARPMKGTMPRGATQAEDDTFRAALAHSEKNQAENLMIVDLLRNDLSRISEIGSVKVPKLFAIEDYATVFQMTSTITAQTRSGVTLPEIFEALFPCGSITGAPKIRAMEILRDIEGGPRGAYCGSIGWIAPDGAMEFNVAIRTLVCRENGQITLNVGGGLVHDSTPEDEYREALLKARFAQIQPGPTLHDQAVLAGG